MIWNFVLAFIGGIFFALLVVAKIASGALQVLIPDNPNEPAYLGIDLGRYKETIHLKKYILCKIEVKNLDSQN